ncbi:MAG: hypothetical protein K8S54_14425 [Spirochaetia bacterium]|nr:hypothetical protein [Spirochaetia bacterium]
MILNTRIALFLALAILLPSILQADTLFLANQKYLRGTIISQTPDEIVFKDESGIERRFKKKDVRRIVYQTPAEQDAADLKLEKARTKQDRIDQEQRQAREKLDPRPEPIVSDAYIPSNTSGSNNGFLLRTFVWRAQQRSDIETRLNDERFYAAGLSGAVGLNAPWSKSIAWGIPIEMEYSFEGLHFEFRYLHALSTPRAIGFELAGNSASLAGSGRADFTDVYLRTTMPELIARYDVSRAESLTFALVAGARQTRRLAEFELEYFPVNVFDSTGLATGGIGRSLAYRVRTQMRDAVFGGDLRAKLSGASELQFRLTFQVGQGFWRQNRTTIDALSNATGSALLRNEDARYSGTGSTLSFGYSYLLSENFRILTRLILAESTTHTGKNLLTRLESNSSGALERYATDLALSGRRRRQADQSVGFEIGGEIIR